jgi:hypothetical protein
VRTSRLFPNKPGFDWCLEVRQAAFLLHDEHDLDVVREHLAGRLGRGRWNFCRGSLFAAVATSEEDIRRLRHETDAFIANRDLVLLTTIHQRVEGGGSWRAVEEPSSPVSNDAIEAELAESPRNERAKPLDLPDGVSWPSFELKNAASGWHAAHAEVVAYLSFDEAVEFAQLLWEVGLPHTLDGPRVHIPATNEEAAGRLREELATVFAEDVKLEIKPCSPPQP